MAGSRQVMGGGQGGGQVVYRYGRGGGEGE